MKKVLILCIGFYRRFLSPLHVPSCRFSPTCSQYALDAVTKYGALKGGKMAIGRVLRCHPFSKGGFDPVK